LDPPFLEKNQFCGNIIVLWENHRKLVEGYDWRKIEKCNGNPMESDVSECQHGKNT